MNKAQKVVHNTEKEQFIMDLGEEGVAYVSYRLKGQHMDLLYSEVPPQLRGKGIGKELVLQTFELLTSEGYTASAYCSYIRTIAKRSEKWRDVIG